MIISFKHKGDLSKADRYFKKLKKTINDFTFEKYGRAGVQALSSATPVDTGKTAASWSYEIVKGNGIVKIIFRNSHFNKNVPIAIILQYGHGTGTGGWVEGRDYINPAIQPVFDKIVKDAWEEVTKL